MWRETTLGDVIELQRGFDLTEKSAAPGPYPVISSSGPVYTTNVRKVDGPGVVTGRKGVLGKVHYSAGPFWPHDTTLWVRDFRGSDPRFVYYLLQTLPLASLDAGASNPTLNRNHAHLLPVRVPDPNTQVLLSAVLGAFDDLIENNRRRIHVLEVMAKAIYKEWFARFRYPGHEVDDLLDSPVGQVPSRWEVKTLADVAVVNRASRIPRAGESVVYLDISCLGDRSIDVPAAIDGGDAPGRARRVVTSGDILWSMVRPNRRAHVLLVDPPSECIASTGLAVLSPTGVPSSFLFEAVSTHEFSDFLVTKESGAAYPAVRPSDFESAPIVVPPPGLAEKFEETVRPCHRLGWQLREESRILSTVRDLLLPKLVTGQIDVSTLDLVDVIGASA